MHHGQNAITYFSKPFTDILLTIKSFHVCRICHPLNFLSKKSNFICNLSYLYFYRSTNLISFLILMINFVLMTQSDLIWLYNLKSIFIYKTIFLKTGFHLHSILLWHYKSIMNSITVCANGH